MHTDGIWIERLILRTAEFARQFALQIAVVAIYDPSCAARPKASHDSACLLKIENS